MGRRRLRDLTYLNPGRVMLLESVADRCKEVSKAFAVRAFTNLDEALKQSPDALVVSTPPALHEPYVQLGLREDKHVFAEVPFLLDYESLLKFAARSARGCSTIVGISHTIRYYPPYRLIRDLLDRNVLGRPLYLEYSLGNYLPDWHPHEDYRKFYASQQNLGGAGMDMLLHELNAIHWWMGPAVSVSGRLTKVSRLEISGPDNHDALLRFESGAVGFFHHDLIERGSTGRHIRIVGEEGTLEWHQNQATLRLYTSSTGRNEEVGFDQASDWPAAMEASREVSKLIDEQRRSGKITTVAVPGFTYESCYLREMRHFLEAVSGRCQYSGSSIEEEVKTVAAFHAVLSSAEKGQEVQIS